MSIVVATDVFTEERLLKIKSVVIGDTKEQYAIFSVIIRAVQLIPTLDVCVPRVIDTFSKFNEITERSTPFKAVESICFNSDSSNCKVAAAFNGIEKFVLISVLSMINFTTKSLDVISLSIEIIMRCVSLCTAFNDAVNVLSVSVENSIIHEFRS